MPEQPKALQLAQAVGEVADELRRLHNEMLYPDRIASDLQDTCHKQAKRIAEQDALLRQVLDDICGAKLCEVNSMSSRAEARRLLDRTTDAIRQHLESE